MGGFFYYFWCMIIDTRHPISKMDFDTESRLLPNEHYRYGKNGRSGTSDKDGDGSTELIRSNILRNESYLPLGTVIGTCPDIRNNAVIKFNCRRIQLIYTGAGVSSTGPLLMVIGTPWTITTGQDIEVIQGGTSFIANVDSIVGTFYSLTLLSGTPTLNPVTNIYLTSLNFIYRYYEGTGQFEFLTNPIAMSNVLNFSLDDRIINPRVIESSFGQLLAWTDGYNQPRLMNIDKMKDGGAFYGIATSEIYISLGKYPPPPPTILLVADTSTMVNNIKDKYFQFAVTYIYEDGQETSLSKYSEVSLRTEDLFIGNPTQENFKNAIDVTFNTGYYTKKVNLYRRIGNGVSETGEENTQWYRWKTYTVLGANQTITQRFFNTEQVTALSRVSSDKLFEAIPLLANEIEVVESTQIVLGDITEGEDPITISANTEAVITEHSQIITSQYLNNDVKWKEAGEPITNEIINIYKQPLFPGDPYEIQVGDLLSIIINKDYLTPDQSVIIINRIITTGDLVGGMQGYATWLDAELTARAITHIYTIFPTVWQFQLTSGVHTYSGSMFRNTGVTDYIPAFSKNYLRTSFKEGANHDLMIIHYDENNRQWPAQPLPTVYVPTLPERYPVSSSFEYIQQSVAIQVELTNQPPLTATSYSIVHRNSLSKSQSFIINSISQSGQNVVITFKKCYDFLIETGIVLDFTDFGAEGTRVRFLTRKYTYAASQIAAPRLVTTIKNTYSVDGYNTTDIELTIANVFLGDISTEIGVGSLFEIFREDSTPFYFEVYNGTITNPKTTNRQYDTYVAGTATMLITKGDSYRYWRSFKYDAETDEATPIYHTESFSINDFNNSYYYNKGRPQIETPDYKRQRLASVGRWGGQLINNTQVNNLSTWDEGNYFQVNARFGAITGLRQIGYTLKIIQWTNINSAFIGRREIQNADGSTQLAVTDTLIGTINPSEREFGTKYPGSIISTGLRLYYFDSLKSKWIVDDGNGVNEIALYMGPDQAPSSTMSLYWRNIATLVNGDSNYDFITGFDFLYRDAYVSIINRTANTQETIYYNETQDAWKYFVDMERLNAAGTVKYIPDCYGNVGQSFFAFMQGNTFQFNKGVNDDDEATYGELFKINSTDPLKPLIVETVAMIEPDKVKVFLTQEYHANLACSLIEIRVPANAMYPNGMYTVLKPANFKYREGVFYADIKRDAYTKGFTTDPTQLKNNIAGGRPIRGHVCTVRITFITNEYVKLFSMGTGMIPSEKS